MAVTAQKLHLIREEIKRIRKLIKQYQEELNWIVKNRIPDTQPWIGGKIEYDVSELKVDRHIGPKSRREEILLELRNLRRYLKWLKTNHRVGRENLARQKIVRSKVQLSLFIKEWEEKGEATPEELESAQTMAAKIVDQNLALVIINPSMKNIIKTLNSIADEQILGSDSEKRGK